MAHHEEFSKIQILDMLALEARERAKATLLPHKIAEPVQFVRNAAVEIHWKENTDPSAMPEIESATVSWSDP
jgi:hypothetical protein